jgi:SAM-dependent methyltransferase
MSYLHKWDLEYAVEFCDHCIPQPAAFIRRLSVERVGWLNTALLKTDHEFWLRVGLTGRIDYLPVLLAHARAIRGQAYNGRRAAADCLRVTRAFYALAGIPPSLLRKRRRAFSNSYLRGMDYAFAGGRHWRIIFGYAIWAALTDPRNAANAFRRLHQYVAAGAAEDARLRWPLKALNLPIWALDRIRHWSRRPPRIPNLLGDRDIEWSWIAAHIPPGLGEALEFGCGFSSLGLIAAERGFRVTAIDLTQPSWPYTHPRLRFLRGDLFKIPLERGRFDLIINCSSVEHVGLVGRYGVIESRPDGDLEAMACLRDLMAPGGVMLLTVPVGRDAVFAPFCRIYGEGRLPRLLQGYMVEREHYWVKDAENRWVLREKEAALRFEASAGSWDPLQNVYALGCFLLRRPPNDGSGE